MNNLGEPCVLYKRSCSRCGECDLCDLDPTKQCDNCCKCLDSLDGDYAEIEIEDILLNSESKGRSHKFGENKYKVKKY